MADHLRVEAWDDFVGQAGLKRQLKIHIAAALADNRALEHVFLSGPPGFGKTSIASVIGHELLLPTEVLMMPIDERALIRALEESPWGVFVLDELHRLSRKQQEMLLPLLEFGYIQTKNGRRYEFPEVTIIGTTTERDKIIAPLLDRFAIKPEFVPYTADEMTEILFGMCAKAGVEVSMTTLEALGPAAAGVPRRARQLVCAARDLIATGEEATPEAILSLLRIEPDGLDVAQLSYLRRIHTNGGAAGLNTLAAMLQLNLESVRDLERPLLDHGFIQYTERGRELTGKGVKRIQLTREQLNVRNAYDRTRSIH